VSPLSAVTAIYCHYCHRSTTATTATEAPLPLPPKHHCHHYTVTTPTCAHCHRSHLPCYHWGFAIWLVSFFGLLSEANFHRMSSATTVPLPPRAHLLAYHCQHCQHWQDCTVTTVTICTLSPLPPLPPLLSPLSTLSAVSPLVNTVIIVFNHFRFIAVNYLDVTPTRPLTIRDKIFNSIAPEIQSHTIILRN
jgi:hypothetical protein